MRSYSYCRMMVNGKQTGYLDIYKEHNVFTIYEHDTCALVTGNQREAVRFVEKWKESYQALKDAFEASGMKVSFEQTIW